VLPDPPTGSELGFRFAIYAALVLLVLTLRSGRNLVRWALALLLGGVGLLSLVVEPVSWLLAGGSPVAFLSTVNALTWGIRGAARAAHRSGAGRVGGHVPARRHRVLPHEEPWTLTARFAGGERRARTTVAV
jgi:hypothetical protein